MAGNIQLVNKMEKTVLRASALYLCIMIIKMTSGEPKLEVAITWHMKLKCNWKGSELVNQLETLQIVKKATTVSPNDTVLVTIDAHKQPSASRCLIRFHYFHQVDGVWNDHSAWVELTLYRVDQTDWHNGDYECQMVFMKDDTLITNKTGEIMNVWRLNTTSGCISFSNCSKEFSISFGESFYILCQVSELDMIPKAELIDTNEKSKLPVCSVQGNGSARLRMLATRVLHGPGEFICECVVPGDFELCKVSDFDLALSFSANDSHPLQCPLVKNKFCGGPETDALEDGSSKESDSVKESSGRSPKGGSAVQHQDTVYPSCFKEIVIAIISAAIIVGVLIIGFFLRKGIWEQLRKIIQCIRDGVPQTLQPGIQDSTEAASQTLELQQGLIPSQLPPTEPSL